MRTSASSSSGFQAPSSSDWSFARSSNRRRGSTSPAPSATSSSTSGCSASCRPPVSTSSAPTAACPGRAEVIRLRYALAWAAVGWLGVALALILSLWPRGAPLPIRDLDKLEHLVGYFLLTFWFTGLY